METADGTSLVAYVYHPIGLTKTPTILVRIPFSKSPRTIMFTNLAGNLWARRGYTAVIQGCRGRFESGGAFYPMLTERSDGIETLAWIAQQSWYDGRIATWGGSAFGQTQWAICDQKNPGPSAEVIYCASSDFGSMFHPGGAFSLYSALTWAVNSHGVKDMPKWPAASTIIKGASGYPMIDADRRIVGREIPFFRDWATHKEHDAYWQKIDGSQRCATMQAPALLIAGWYDPFLPTQLHDFQDIKQLASPEVSHRTRLIIGPWTHAGQVTLPGGKESEHFRLTSMAVSLPWFDDILRNRAAPAPTPQSPLSFLENTLQAVSLPELTLPLTVPWVEQLVDKAGKQHASTAPVRIFVMGENKWRDENEWPLARTKYTAFYLHSDGQANSTTGDGSLTAVAPVGEEAHDSYLYNPCAPVPTAGGAMIGPAAGIANQTSVEKRTDVLVYSTAPLSGDLEATGPVSATLYVSTTAPCTDFTAKLVDVYPDGTAYNLCDGILRRPYASSNTKAGDQVHEITIDLWPTSNVFRKGHKIRLEISSSNFPRFDRNPNTTGDSTTETAPLFAAQHVRHQAQYPSRLILPIIRRH